MANSNGGRIIYGQNQAGENIGLNIEIARALDSAAVMQLVNSYIAPSTVTVSHERHDLPQRKCIVELVVHPSNDLAIVFSKNETYKDGKSVEFVFRKGEIVVREGAANIVATKTHIDHMFAKRVCTVSEQIAAVVCQLIDQYPILETNVEPVLLWRYASGELSLAPSTLLRVGVERRRSDPSYVLTPNDLLWLSAVGTEAEKLRENEADLVIRSAFRRKATLYYWLRAGFIFPNLVYRVAETTVTTDSDRDVSDAAQSVIEAIALFESEERFLPVIHLMEKRYEYKHFVDAATRCKEWQQERSRVLEELYALSAKFNEQGKSAQELVESARDLAKQCLRLSRKEKQSKLRLLGDMLKATFWNEFWRYQGK